MYSELSANVCAPLRLEIKFPVFYSYLQQKKEDSKTLKYIGGGENIKGSQR